MRRGSAFFKYARERYSILLRKRGPSGRRGPGLTDDPILQRYRFCNIFREDDTTTAWIRQNVREPLETSHRLVEAMAICRWFNRISTLELLLGDLQPGAPIRRRSMFQHWNSREVRRRLREVHPLVSGAYIIKTPAGMNKLDGLIWCIEQFRAGRPRINNHLLFDEPTLESTTKLLTTFPYLGPFMSYEIVTDLRHTVLLRGARDIRTWANPGPGATRGAGRVERGDPGTYNRHSWVDAAAVQRIMARLLDKADDREYWPREWPHWEMRDVEHTLCEFDKYERARLGQGRPKQLYRGATLP